MKNFFTLCREHKIAIILAVLTSIIVAFPQIYFRIEHRNDGLHKGIELLPDSPWSGRTREIQDGNGLGSIYFAEGKEDPYLFQPAGSMVVAYIGKIFGLDINNTILASRLLLPSVTFLLIYLFIFLFARDRFAALSGASLLLLAESVLSYHGIISILQGVSPDDFLRIARPVNPAMIYILFFAFLSTFWMYFKKGCSWWGLVSILLLGSNFYNYFYTWTFLYAFGSILGVTVLWQKKWASVTRVAVVFLGALLLLIPYGINLYSATLHPAYEEASMRFGVVASHTPLFVGMVVVISLIIFAFGWPRERRKEFTFGLALLATPFVTMNQQLLTGKVMQVSHYHWFFHKPIAVIFVVMVVFYILSHFNLQRYRRVGVALLVGMSFAVGVFMQTASYLGDGDGGERAIERQKYGPVLEWINTHSTEGDIIFANNETSYLTTIYTSRDVLYHRAGMYSLSATKERLMDTLFLFYRLRGVDADSAEIVFKEERAYLSWNIYGMHYRETRGGYEYIPDELVAEAVRAYQNTFSFSDSEWLHYIRDKYRVTYVVWDKSIDSAWNLNTYTSLKEVAHFDTLSVYAFID